MARKRIVAYFMHEDEAAYVIPRLYNPNITDSFAVGEIDEREMARLAKRGIIFQDVEVVERPSLQPAEEEERVVAAAADVTIAPSLARAPVSSNSYYLTLLGPLLSEWRKQLEAMGVIFRVALPNYRWLTLIPADKLAEVKALSFVKNLEMRESNRNLPTRQEFASFGTPIVPEMVAYDVLLDKAAPLPDFLNWLQQHNISVAVSEGNKVRIYLLENDARLTDISELTDWVYDIQPFKPPELHNDHARVLLGIDGPPAINPQFHFPWEGETEIVGVADTGLDDTHPDFANRIVERVPLGRPGDPSDPHGHGTHVAGSILGDGSASNGCIRGVAPKARIFFQSLLDKNGGLGGLPFRLGTLFADAYKAGVRIHNDSWGSVAMGAYRVNSMEVDEYVYSQKDMLIVMSAGNDGTAADPLIGARNSAVGYVDWLSLGSPATAKNALTVGASRSDRTAGGYSSLTYGDVWPLKFPASPIASDTISGDSDSMAGFSSRGACDDYRIKPDVVAPGTDIISCRSSLAPLYIYWGPDFVNPHYAYMGGTSMAAPLVSGCAAIVRQYYTQQRNHLPSAALLKATLINSTRWLTGQSSTADFNQLPNIHQGFGCVYLPMAVPNPLLPGFALEFYDNWATPNLHFTTTGQSRRFSFNLNLNSWLRITLAYTDPPGRALQNNLNLFLQLPDGSKMFGNMNLPFGMNRPDATNNVEVIRLQNANAGRYLIQVVASNLLEAQDFALVVTGSFSAPMVEV